LGDLPSFDFVLEVEYELSGRFRGTVCDSWLPAVAGTVEGSLCGARVEFVKRMPILYLLEPNRFRHIGDCVREWWDMELDGPVPAPPIFYEGVLSQNGHELAGRWWIDKTTIPIPSGGQRYALDLPMATGRWTARQSASVAGAG
jgi:hypothetical protein